MTCTQSSKAWIVTDDEECWDIVFADTRSKARYAGSRRFDIACDPEYWMSLRVQRAPGLDQYAGGEIPMWHLVMDGWWTECNHCGTTINSDLAYEGHDLTQIVGHWHGYHYCSPTCQEERHALIYRKNAIITQVRENVESRIMRMFADRVTFSRDPHIYIDDSLQVAQVLVYFKFPDQRYGECMATTEGNDPRSLQEFFDTKMGVRVPQGDRRDFNKFFEEVKAISLDAMLSSV